MRQKTLAWVAVLRQVHQRQAQLRQWPFDGGAVANTDGIALVATSLGPEYPTGLLVVQDGFIRKPARPTQNQNFKLVSWEAVASALALETP